MYERAEVVTRPLRLFLCFYILAVLFGAPLWTDIKATACLSGLLCLLTGLPLFAIYSNDSQLLNILLSLKCTKFTEKLAAGAVYGTLVGCYLGAFVIPLDWDRWWQRYPLPNIFGAVAGAEAMTSETHLDEDADSSFDITAQPTFPDMPDLLMPSVTAPSATITPCSSAGSLSPPTSYGEGVFGKFKHTDVPKLRAVFFSFFDNSRGTEILFQVPKDLQFIRDRFGLFSAAIIPKDELLNKLVKISYEDFSVMGHCVGLGWHGPLGKEQLISEEHPEYNRGVLLFNMCFVVMKESILDCMYEPLVQKVAEYLIELEQECLYISTTRTRNRLHHVMRAIFEQLNQKGECVHPVEGTMTTIYLKLCPSYRGTEPPKVALYMVPMLTRNVACTDPHIIAKMDVLSQKIIPKIDGVRCVKEIACEVDIDADLVSRCVRNLVFYECVSLVPLFLYQNCYVSTEKLHDFYKSSSKIQECLEFVRLRRDNNQLGPIPKFNDVFRLYMSLTCGYTMDRWCREMNPRQYFVDERRLVQFGMYHKFVRKLSVYPVATVNRQERIFTLCDGTNALEDLAVLYSVPPTEMYDYLKKSRSFQFISK